MFGKMQQVIIKFPNGRFGFAGTIDVRLAMVNKDGSELSPEQARECAGMNIPGMKYNTRSFESVAQARYVADHLDDNTDSLDEPEYNTDGV